MTGLEAIEIIRDKFIEYKNKAEGTNIKCLISPQFAQVRTELKALEIIKEKECDIFVLRVATTVEHYNKTQKLEQYKLTEEEFSLLKEVLSSSTLELEQESAK